MDFSEMVAQLRRSTVEVHIPREAGGGSGVVWRADGLIVTNAHVARAPRLAVELHDGRTFEAQVAARDPGRDLAALRIEAAGLAAAKIGDPSKLRVGEVVVAVGNPLGVSGAAAAGIVQSRPRGDWIRADLRLAPGNSGGPLANARGEIVGVNAMIHNGLALAVPATAVESFLRPDGAAQRPRLGVTLCPVRHGLLVLEVEPGSLAGRYGVLLGDVITEIHWGPPVALDLVRAGRALRLTARAA